MAAIDLGTKAWASSALSRSRGPGELVEVCAADRGGLGRMQRLPTRAVQVVPGFAGLKYAENCGGPFGFLKQADASVRYPIFIGATALALVALVVVGLGARGRPAVGYALALLAGGAIGNLTDRIRLGYVVDFIDLHAGAYSWPTFNVADIAVTAGLALVVLDSLRAPRDLDHAAAREEPPPAVPEGASAEPPPPLAAAGGPASDENGSDAA